MIAEWIEWLRQAVSLERFLWLVGGFMWASAIWLGPRVFRRVRKWWWIRRLRRDPIDYSLFAYRGIAASIRVVDAILENLRGGYRDEMIRISTPAPYVPLSKSLSNETNTDLASLKRQFDERREYWLSVMKAGGKSIWDNYDLLSFDQITILREGEDEHHRIDIAASHGSYLDHRAITDCFKSLDTAKQRSLLSEFEGGSKYFSRLTAICAAVITADGMILFPKRSRKITSDPGLITCGVNEAIKVSDTHQRSVLSVPKRAILRGLDEEYGVSVRSELLDRIQLFSLVQHARYFEWYFYGWADFRGCGSEYTAHRLLENLRIGKAKDKYEFEPGSTVAVEFTIGKIIKFIRENRTNMTEYGASLPVLAAKFDGQDLKHGWWRK
jgi:hypothetical protein